MPQHLQAAYLEMEANRAEQQRNIDMQRAHKQQVDLAKVSFFAIISSRDRFLRILRLCSSLASGRNVQLCPHAGNMQ